MTRSYIYHAAGLTPEFKIGRLGPNRESYKRRKIPGTGALHEEGWMSAECKRGRHGQCFSRNCSCPCSKRVEEFLTPKKKTGKWAVP